VSAAATAKLNLALVVGPQRPDGKHDVVTVLQRIDLVDRIELRRSNRLTVSGFPADTLVHGALQALAQEAGVEPAWHIRIRKRIPVAAGLGGGSSDAATALRLANAELDHPLRPERLAALAASLGSDVPFFLTVGPQLAEGDGTTLRPVALPQDYFALVVLPHGEQKAATAAVYKRFDERDGAEGFEARRAVLEEKLAAVRRASDLADLPLNDLASSTVADELRSHGAFRADVTGAGPAVYGLFLHRHAAEEARRSLGARGHTWIAVPAWYV
jgi:4-diphosphocytidyl-2-C-methyl-D-erythritol kinase